MKILIANWKMAPEKKVQAIDLAKKSNLLAKKYKKNISLIICSPSIHISNVSKFTKTAKLGAQWVSSITEIAQTGLISANMLKDYGVEHCIIGHSESRSRGDTNEIIKEQSKRLLEKKIISILCVGETERDSHGWYLSTVKDQIESILKDIPKSMLKYFIIAYEPVWAIGKNAIRQANPEECNEMVIFIRKIITDIHGEKSAALVNILYGGSVDEINAINFVKEGNIQGFLVGRASLDIKKFEKLTANIVSI